MRTIGLQLIPLEGVNINVVKVDFVSGIDGENAALVVA